MKRYRVVYTANAARQYEREVTRWRRTHPKNTYLLEDEIHEAIRVMTVAPRWGEESADARLPEARRAVLEKSEYLLYYYVYDDERRVELLGLWYARRGTRPTLRIVRRKPRRRTRPRS